MSTRYMTPMEASIAEMGAEWEAEERPKHEDSIDQSRKNKVKINAKVVKSESLSKPYEWRFVVIDEDTGEILDNAQGYGYKTKQKAMAAWNYKNRDKSKDAAKKAKEKLVKDWMKHHKGFVNAMAQYCFEIECKHSWGPEDKFNAKFVRQMLKDYGLELDGFTAGDLLRVWRKS